MFFVQIIRSEHSFNDIENIRISFFLSIVVLCHLFIFNRYETVCCIFVFRNKAHFFRIILIMFEILIIFIVMFCMIGFSFTESFYVVSPCEIRLSIFFWQFKTINFEFRSLNIFLEAWKKLKPRNVHIF